MSVLTSARPTVEKYYALIDSGQLSEACEDMTEGVKLTFANAEPVHGPAAAEASIQLVLDHCTRVQHTLLNWYEKDHEDGSKSALFEIRIQYWLNSGRELDLPGAVFAQFDADGQITEQRLYGDLAEVFAG